MIAHQFSEAVLRLSGAATGAVIVGAVTYVLTGVLPRLYDRARGWVRSDATD